MDSLNKMIELSNKLQECVLPSGWIKVGKSDAIPLIALELYSLLDENERITYCNALVSETYLSPLQDESGHGFISSIELAEEAIEKTCKQLSYSPKSQKKRCTIPEAGPFKSLGHTNTHFIDYAAWQFRPAALLVRLRDKIFGLRQKADVYAYVRNRSVYKETVYDNALPEMDSNDGPSEQTVITSNVVLGETQAESIDVADVPKNATWHELSTTEENPSYSNLTDRFTFWKSFEWTTESNDILIKHEMPRDFVNSYDRCKMPMFIPFQIHQYMRGDIEIKLHINSNKFQAGQLIASWWYGTIYDRNDRTHIADLVQLPHVIISAGASNEATLIIPYRYHLAYMNTKKRKGFLEPLSMGSLIIRPLVRLSTSVSGPKACNISIFVRFKSVAFTGMIDGSLVEPEMDIVGNLIQNASKLLNAPNCDNPPLNTPPRFLVPTASHSWSIGNDIVEPIHRLSLQKSIGFKHVDDTAAEDIRHSRIVNKFGLLKIITWNSADVTSNKTGTLLWSCNAHPQIDKSLLYNDIKTEDQLIAYYVPPCGVVSSMYEYWRGSLEFKFDIVATSFHTGRILIAYIPGIHANKKVSLEQARNSAHIVFSLQDSSTFTFTVPYIGDRPWWKRRYGGPQSRSEFASPSSLFMFILNPLVPMESVSKVIQIVPYIRAGNDFELAVPVQPSIGLGWNRDDSSPGTPMVEFKSGYFPVYVGQWHNFGNSKRAIFRYGNVSDHVAQIDKYITPSVSSQVYVYKADVFIKAKMRNPNASDFIEANITHGVPYKEDDYIYMVPFFGLAEALTFARQLSIHGTNGISNYAPFSDEDSAFSVANIRWTPSTYDIADDGFHIVALPEMERELNPNVMQPTSNLKTTRGGHLTFGENFQDLKDLCRRYQLYWDYPVVPPTTYNRDYVLLQLTIRPQGLYLGSPAKPMWNISREGHLPLIASGFRFYRGGIRMRVIVTNYDGIVWVQYRPDRPLTTSRGITGDSILKSDRYRNHSYPYYIQDMRINRIIELEIPYYQPGIFGILGETSVYVDETDVINFTTLGDLVVGVEGGSIPKNIEIAVYYSIADDFSMNTYIGFPPMVFCDETALPEMEFANSFVSTVAGTLFGRAVTAPVVEKVKDLRKKIVEDIVKEAQQKIQPLMEDLTKTTSEGANKICSVMEDGILKQALVNSIGQLFQVMLNPSPASLAIAICSLLGSLVIVSLELILTIQDLFTKFLDSVWHKYFVAAPDLQEAGQDAMPEGGKDDDGVSPVSVFSAIFGLVTTTLGVSFRKPKDWPSLTKGLKDDFGLINNATLFFKNSLETLIYCYEYCIGEMSDVNRAKRLVAKEYPDLKLWIEDVISLLDPRRRRLIFKSSKEANRVFDACQYGALIIRANIDKSCPGGKIVFDLYSKVCKLRDDIVEGGNHPNVRFEPFPIYIVGKQGVGKSFMTTKICKELLKHINYKSGEEMIYWLQLGQKYWNGIGNPPVVARDEAYAVDGAMTEEEIQVHMQMCSCSVFNPPMAAVEEKNKRINPLIYYMNSNVEFPSFVNARCPRAIYRRRKILCRIQFTSAILAKYPNILDAEHISAEDRVNDKHLEFFLAVNPSDPETTWTGPLSYNEFLDITKNKFRQHYESERINFKNRMRDNYCLDPDFDETDDLEFVHETTRTYRTLREQFDETRQNYQDIIDEDELDEEESYFRKIVNKGKKIYSSVFPEIDEAIERTECSTASLNEAQHGFYSRDRREQIRVLFEGSDLGREAAVKILSGTDVSTFEEEDLAGFSIMHDFAPIVENPARKYEFWVGTHDSAFFRIGGSQQWGVSEIAHDDREQMGRWHKSALPHWRDRTGTEALRCRAFWLMRQAQWLDIISSYDIEEHMREFRTRVRGQELAEELDEITYETINDPPLNAYMFANFTQYQKSSRRMQLLLTYLKQSGMSRKTCEHAKVWTMCVNDLGKVKFNIRTNTITTTDVYGMDYTISADCNCNNNFSKLMKNKLFIRSMKVIWGKDHGISSVNCPFRMSEHDQTREEATTWLGKIKDWIHDWWIASGKPFINNILRFIREHLFTILTALLGVFLLYKSCKAPSFTGKMAYTYFGSTFASAGLRSAFTEGGPNYYRDAGVPRRGSPGTAPAAREFVEIDVNVEKKVLNNACFVKCTYKDGERHREIKGRCLGIRNHQVLVIRHYFEEFSNYKDIGSFQLVLCKNGIESYVELAWEDFDNIRYLRVNNQDRSSNFGIWTCPSYVPMFNNIVNLFPTHNMHKNVRSEADFICIKGPSKRSIRIEKDNFLRIAGVDSISELCLDAVYKYAHHGAGLCGSVLLSAGLNNGNLGIIGMHVAGKNGIGYAEPLCREWFETCIPKEKPEYVLPNLDSLDRSMHKLDGNMIFYGCVKDAYAHRESGKSQIVPSLLHNQVYPVKTEPNPLRPNDPRQPPGSDPLRDGCNKHGVGYPGRFELDILDLVNVDSRQVLINECKPTLSKLRPLSYQESICGNPDIPMCDALKWNTSEGFPLSIYRPKGSKGKKWLFNIIESEKGLKLEGMNDRLETLLRTRERMRNENKVLPSIYVDCLKDYRLTPAKCAIPGKTRIFSIAPVQTTIDTRRYMGNFLSAYKNATIRAEHAIGINVDSLQWTELVHYLTSKGLNIVTGDYGNFGPTLSSQLVAAVIDDIIYWHKHYGASEEHIKHLNRILLDEILTPFHLCGNLVYQPLNGIGSGSPVTAELNSEVNKKYIKFAWIKIMRAIDPNKATMDEFHRICTICTYGDDFIMGVNDEYKNIFNCKTISDCLRSYGIELTSADKSYNIKPYGTLNEATFLKRSFRQHPVRAGVWLAPIEEQSVTECLNWCHKSESLEAATSEVIRASMDLAYGHGEKYYTEHRDKINSALKLHNIKIELKEWKTRDVEIFGY